MDRLFVYGTLQPGAPNEYVLKDVEGTCEPATVSGRLVAEGWGAAAGYAGLVLDASAGEVPGQILSAESLAAVWDTLDAFEGDDYERTSTEAICTGGDRVEVQLYVLRGA